jgi:hypothetical protein
LYFWVPMPTRPAISEDEAGFMLGGRSVGPFWATDALMAPTFVAG